MHPEPIKARLRELLPEFIRGRKLGLAIVGIAGMLHLTGCNTCIPCNQCAPTNYSAWMEENLAILGSRHLAEIVLPASHDSAMYKPGFLGWGRTQCESMSGQLTSGIRWFDLRPYWDGHNFRFHHGPIVGPSLKEVLTDVQAFARRSGHELIILKFSDFACFDEHAYELFKRQIHQSLAPWLVQHTAAALPLRQRTINDFVTNGTSVLVLVDGCVAIPGTDTGIWIYSDFDRPYAKNADLRVYDVYSRTPDYRCMVYDQLNKFSKFGGCGDKSNDCDMFLLSWTVTPNFRIWAASKPALIKLEPIMGHRLFRNENGKVLNLLYTDFAGLSKSTDIAIAQNRRLNRP